MRELVVRVLPAIALGTGNDFGLILDGLQVVKDLARGCMNPGTVHIHFTQEARKLSMTPEHECVTLMPDASYTNNTSYGGVVGLAEGCVAPYWLAGWSNYSPATGECRVRNGQPEVSAPRRENQRAA
jgi:hypothetical protein